MLELKENIISGFGVDKIWYIEYERLLGQKWKRVTLLQVDNSDITFPDYYHQKTAIGGFFRIFNEMFPGFDTCIKNLEFVCKIGKEQMDKITENIKMKLINAGQRLDDVDVKHFLGSIFSSFPSRSFVTPVIIKLIICFSNTRIFINVL